tara:strand:+ start:17795 stop:18100 length:306 start_codon:yes stop_codon:yes gene_type:complete
MTDDEPLTAEDLPLPGGDFRLFITRLSFQGLLSCGLLENPVTQTKQINLPGARMVLDDLRMLREKTVGNLTDEEIELIDKTVEQLTQAYGLAMNGEISSDQ